MTIRWNRLVETIPTNGNNIEIIKIQKKYCRKCLLFSFASLNILDLKTLYLLAAKFERPKFQDQLTLLPAYKREFRRSTDVFAYDLEHDMRSNKNVWPRLKYKLFNTQIMHQQIIWIETMHLC